MMEQPLCDPGVGGGTGSVLLAPLSQQLESCSRQSDWFRAHHLPHQLSVAAPSSTSRSCGLDSQNDSAAPEQFRSLGQARNAWPGVLVFNDSGLTEVFRSQLVCLLLRPVCAFCRSLFRIFFCRHGRTITRVTDPVFGVCVCVCARGVGLVFVSFFPLVPVVSTNQPFKWFCWCGSLAFTCCVRWPACFISLFR